MHTITLVANRQSNTTGKGRKKRQLVGRDSGDTVPEAVIDQLSKCHGQKRPRWQKAGKQHQDTTRVSARRNRLKPHNRQTGAWRDWKCLETNTAAVSHCLFHARTTMFLRFEVDWQAKYKVHYWFLFFVICPLVENPLFCWYKYWLLTALKA